MPARSQRRSSRAGLTLIELIVAFTILLILSTMSLPLAKVKVRREKERRLHEALYEMRTAIDRYKDAADQGLLGQQDPDNHGYPESLDILVEGVEVNSNAGMGGTGAQGMSGMSGMTPASRMGSPGMGQQRGGFGQQQSGFGGQGGFGQQRGGIGQSGSSFGSNRSGGSSGFGQSGRSSGFGQSGSSGVGSRGDSNDKDGEQKKMRFLRKIPVDPMTGRAEWGMRSVTDSPDSMNWGGDNVFDVFSLTMESSLDGVPYSQW